MSPRQRPRLLPFAIAILLSACAAQREAQRDARSNGGGDGGGTGSSKFDAQESTGDCTAWAIGTLTGYNNSNLADDPNAGSVMEFRGLTDPFYDNVPMVAVDMSNWDSDKYHWLDVDFNGTIGHVQVWDACSNADCPNGQMCCTDNKTLFATPGYLVDVETRTAKRIWNVTNAEDTLRDEIHYRVCGTFDPDAIASQYGAHR